MQRLAFTLMGLLIIGVAVSDPAAADPYRYRGHRQGYHRPYVGYPYFPLSSGVVFPVPNSYHQRRPKVLGEPLGDPRRGRGYGGGCRYIVAEAYNSKGVSRSICTRR